MTSNANKQQTITVTAKAAETVLNLMAERELDGHYLRVFVAGFGCSGLEYGLAFSKEPRDGDTAFDSNGIRVLVDPTSLILLDGATVDYVDTPEGADFRIDNPNVTPISACDSCSGSCG
jgi:iron-sulfur cluster assembly accessory protein